MLPKTPLARFALLQESLTARVAGPWQVDAGPKIRTARGKDGKPEPYIYMTLSRRGPKGEPLGEVVQKGTVYEWSMAGAPSQVVNGINFGSTRTASTLLEAMLDVDGQLLSATPPYELCGTIWTGTIESEDGS